MIRAVLMACLVLLIASCTPRPVATLPGLIPEQDLRPDVRDQIAHRLQWMGPEQVWHYNCLFGKSVSEIVGGEQQMILPSADLMFRGYWEERRLAYRSAGFLFRQAADNGVPLAFANLGRYLTEGLGVPVNSQGGGRLLYQAARLDCAIGQHLYADFITKGRAVVPNLFEAYAWARMATDQGYTEARPLVLRIRSLLGPSQMAVAEQRRIALRQQLDLFNQGEKGQQLVNCITDRNPTAFVTRLKACHAMEGRSTPF